jgi:hypothetical protein
MTSEVPQGSALGPLLFLEHLCDIWKNIESTLRFFPNDCIIYSKMLSNNDVKNLQMRLNRARNGLSEMNTVITKRKNHKYFE